MSQEELRFSLHDDLAFVSTQFAMHAAANGKPMKEVMGHVREAYESHLKARHHRASIVTLDDHRNNKNAA